jgi:Stealth protein CR2, conserved region 2/Stealth protein CR4, conserved region 4/Stealth protein CR3, conserved region 3/Stealth protein CR1, conserved region 1
MLTDARRRVAAHLPERTVYSLVRIRHGETLVQRRIRRAAWVSRARLSPPGPSGYLDGPTGVREVRARIVTEFDAHEVRRQNILAVSAALESRGIPHVLVPTAGTDGQRVAVSAEDKEKTLDAVASVLDTPEWAVEWRATRSSSALKRGHMAVRASTTTAALVGKAVTVRVYRLLAAPNGEGVASAALACNLDFWTRVDTDDISRPDGGTFDIGTRLAPVRREIIVSYLSPTNWEMATLSPGHWPPAASHTTLFQVREPVDIVYTWVDGDDPLWLARKATFDATLVAGELNLSATHESRYASRDELRYSLRSVAMYASWVRKIFIVTDQQVPAWLDTSHPKIEVIDHSTIFSDPAALPVFNSHAIESQLHHIPNLSERYLYLNDDVFFGRPVQPELFFHGNGIGKFFLSTATLDIDPPSSEDLPVMSAAKRNRELIEQRFDATVIHKFKHTPHSQLRTVLEQMEEEYPDMFAAVSRSRFRHPDDLSITSALHHYYAYGIGRAMPARIRYAYQDIARVDTARWLTNLLRRRGFDVFCLNDHATDAAAIRAQQRILAEFFERYFPIPSPFELPAAHMAPNKRQRARSRLPVGKTAHGTL